MSTKFKFFPSSNLGRFILISSILTILCVVLSVVVAFRFYVTRAISYAVPLTGDSSSTQIKMWTQYVDVDDTAATLTADWYLRVISCESDDLTEVINIYFDRNLLNSEADSNRITSDQPPNRPIFQLRCRNNSNVRNSMNMFRTVVKLIAHESTRLTGPSLQWYPWDRYYAEFSFFAQLNSTNASVAIITSDTILGSPVNFNIRVDQQGSENSRQFLSILLLVTRSVAVRVLVVFIVVANWIVTIAFLWITVASFMWPEDVVKEMFVIPIASLFAFTSVRSNMPGAPQGFGAFIDFVGILPNIALMTFFSAVLLLVVLFRRTYSKPKEKLQEDKPVYGQVGDVEGQNQT